jgi:hypothetical protein
MSKSRVVQNAEELLEAVGSDALEIQVRGTISGAPMITLRPGVTLRGGVLRFGAKGVRLTSQNTLDDVTVHTADDEVAILNDTSVEDLRTLTLRGVTTIGQVLLLAEGAVRSGHIVVDGLHVERADVRGRAVRPHGFGVEALQGGFTLWNRQADDSVQITADLRGISAGSEDAPVRGSGVFVGGHGDWEGHGDGGTLKVSTLRTGEIHTDGGIPPGTPDLISGGVFVISGAHVEDVRNEGPVTTYGQNDMVLDNWGEVRDWSASAAVTSRGPSGIGFVNFGRLSRLDVQAPLQTFGTGARGFNVYDGSLDHASFDSIATHGDGSTGVQVSKPLRVLEVRGDLSTEGGEGMSLVKGVQMTLKAIALSIKPGGSIGKVSIGGALRTSGANVVTLEAEGEIGEIAVTGGITATGAGSDAVHLSGHDIKGLDKLKISAEGGEPIRRKPSASTSAAAEA